MVHPSDLGNLAEGYPGLTGQTFADPTVPSTGVPTNTEVSAWKGGCGREPLTTASGKSATASPDPNSDKVTALNPSGQTCADGTHELQRPSVGLLGLPGERRQGLLPHLRQAQRRLAASASTSTTSTAAATSGNSNFQVPNGTNEITVDKNGDNSIQTNAFDRRRTARTASPSTRTAPGVTTAIHNAAPTRPSRRSRRARRCTTPSRSRARTATTPTGHRHVRLVHERHLHAATPAATSSAVALTAAATPRPRDAAAFAQTPGGGLYSFLAHYSGDVYYSAKDGACEPLAGRRRQHRDQPADGDERRRHAARLHGHGAGEPGHRAHERAGRHRGHVPDGRRRHRSAAGSARPPAAPARSCSTRARPAPPRSTPRRRSRSRASTLNRSTGDTHCR